MVGDIIPPLFPWPGMSSINKCVFVIVVEEIIYRSMDSILSYDYVSVSHFQLYIVVGQELSGIEN